MNGAAFSHVARAMRGWCRAAACTATAAGRLIEQCAVLCTAVCVKRLCMLILDLVCRGEGRASSCGVEISAM
eukprot:2193561-Prymnesium_polylepis.1